MKTSTGLPYRRIGQGFCGTVWAASTTGNAVKREDGGPGRSLHNDFVMYRRILDSFSAAPASSSCTTTTTASTTTSAYTPRARVPQCHRYIPAGDTTWWTEQHTAHSATTRTIKFLKSLH